MNQLNIDTDPAFAANSDEATIRHLTEQWFKEWSPGTSKFDIQKLRSLFAQEEGELLVVDNIATQVTVLHSWDEYRDTWEPFMEQFDYWVIRPEGEIQVMVDGNLAVTNFTLVGEGRYFDGREIKPKQYGTHVWKKQSGRWVIVHEHLTADGD